MAEEKFKLPRSSYDELAKVIRAYGRLNTPSTLNEVDQLAGIGKTNVSANNAFLLNIEIIEGAKTKGITSKGSNLARALEHDMKNEISRAWRTIVNENDFLSKMVQAVSIRNGMEISHLTNHIAYSAGETKSSYVLTGAKAVIDILFTSGLIIEDGDRALPNESIKKETDKPVQRIEPTQTTETEIPQHKIQVKPKTFNRGVSLLIEVRIDVGPDELDGLGEKIKNLISDITEHTNVLDQNTSDD